MSKSDTQTSRDQTTKKNNFKYIYRGIVGERDTRHEAIGDLAKYGDWNRDSVVAITESCLVDWNQNGPVHLGNKYYGDRDYIATKHGEVKINKESLVRFVNNDRQEVVKTEYYGNCPICGLRVSVDGGSEDDRREFVQQILDHCGTEWFSPSDWIEDCDVCGGDHREKHECRSLRMREGENKINTLDQEFECHNCDWTDHGSELGGVRGTKCPRCESNSVAPSN